MAHILLISTQPYYPWKGTCHRLRHTLEALAALGHEVDLITVPESDLPPLEKVTRYSVPRLPFCADLPDGPSLRRISINALMLAKAVYLANRKRYTLVHGYDDGGVVASFVGRLTKTPCVFERTFDFSKPCRSAMRGFWLRLYAVAEKRAFRRCSAVIGNDSSLLPPLSRAKRRSLACIIPDIPALETRTPPETLKMAQARFRSRVGQKLIVCVGSCTKFQGLDLFFNAIPHILVTQPDARFVVVGGSAAEIERMREALTKAQVDDAVVFTGRIQPEELSALLLIADVLVSPRRAGSSAPIKVLDYLNFGIPIAAVDTPANRAILTPENAVITAAEPEALAQGILQLCRQPALGRRLAQRGRQTLVKEHRTPHDFRAALASCYDYVLSISDNPDLALRL